MRFSFRTVPFHLIDMEDERFRVSTPEPIDDLADAIERIGLLYPPILFETGHGGYVIIAGFKRIMACRRLTLTAIEARIMPGDTPPSTCLSVAIADNTLHRALNFIEQSIAVSKLAAFYHNDADLSRIAVDLGLAVNPGLVEKLKRIPMMSAALQRSILSGTIPLSIAFAIDGISSPLAERLISIFDQLRPTLNQQKQILEWVRDLARMDKEAASHLLADEKCRSILSDADLDRPRKVRRLMDFLRRRRFPVMSAFADEYRQRMQKLDLPPGMDMIPPGDFETDCHRMVLDFHSLTELEIQIAGLRALTRDNDFLALINKDFADRGPLH